MLPRQGGIDSGMQQAILSAGSDPRKLQQGYEQSVKQGIPDLAMLLGMQKLKSEKEAAAKEMQMQMDQKPQTIIQQREAELMGQTQQEVQQKIAPGMQQAGAQAKQEAFQKQMMGRPNPATSGIAQAASPQQFAAGGIVGFAGDGYTGPEDVDYKKIVGLIKQGLPVDAIKEMFPNVSKRALESATDIAKHEQQSGALGRTGAGIRAVGNLGLGAIEDIYGRAKPLFEGAANVTGALSSGLLGSNPTAPPAPATPAPDPMSAAKSMAASVPTPPTGIAQAAPNLAPPAPAGPAAGGMDKMTTDMRKRDFDLAQRNSETDKQLGRADYKTDQAATLANIGESKAMRGERRAETDSQNDPRKRRRERFQAFAAGAGGRNSTAMAGGIAGASNARNSQEAKRLDAIDKLGGMLNKETDANKAYGTGLTASGVDAKQKADTRYDAASGRVQRTGLESQANELRAETNQMIARNDSDQKKTTQLGVIEGRILSAQEAVNDAMSEGAVGQQMMRLQSKLRKMDEDDPKRAVVQQAMAELKEQVSQAVGGDSIKVLVQLRQQLMESMDMAPPVSSGGDNSGWSQAKKVK